MLKKARILSFDKLIALEYLKYYKEGFAFLKNFVYKLGQTKVKLDEIYLPSKKFFNKVYRTKRFFPNNYNPKTTKAILLTHGMSVYGIGDLRILELAYNLCLQGYLVFIPEFEEVKSLKITFETSENIYDICNIILNLEDLYLKNSLGVLCISFTGGMGLVALSNTQLLGKVTSILAIGAYSNFDILIQYAVSNFQYDNYASFVFFYNYIDKVIDKAQELKKILLESAIDNALYRYGEDCRSKQMEKYLSKRDKEIYNSICLNGNFRQELAKEICKELGNLIHIASPINYIENLVAPVSLIHGKEDKVIPESESIEIANVLKKKGKKFNLEITGLLSHGDKVPIWKKASDVPGLAKAFGFFLRQI